MYTWYLLRVDQIVLKIKRDGIGDCILGGNILWLGFFCILVFITFFTNNYQIV